MALYDTLAPIYDRLFPVNPAFSDFIARHAFARGASDAERRTPGRPHRALDAGSGTGGHAIALAVAGWEAVGVEPSAPMVETARVEAAKRGLGGASFIRGDMRDAEALVGPGPFDLVLCLGNTLPHLTGGSDIAAFLAAARRLLAPGGALAVQLLDYGKPGLGPGFVFPEIRIEGFAFRRRYAPSVSRTEKAAAVSGNASPGVELLRFRTELVDERAGTTQSDETLLAPILPGELVAALEAAGFPPPELFGGWAGARFSPEDDVLIALARRPSD